MTTNSTRMALGELQAEIQCDCWTGVACTQDCYAHRATFRALTAVLDVADIVESNRKNFDATGCSDLADTAEALCRDIRKAIATALGLETS